MVTGHPPPPPPSSPLGHTYQNRRHFRSPNGMQMLFTKGKCGRRSQGKNRDMPRAIHKERKTRVEEEVFFSSASKFGLSFSLWHKHAGWGRHTRNKLVPKVPNPHFQSWMGGFFFFFLLVVVTIGECVCVTFSTSFLPISFTSLEKLFLLSCWKKETKQKNRKPLKQVNNCSRMPSGFFMLKSF